MKKHKIHLILCFVISLFVFGRCEGQKKAPVKDCLYFEPGDWASVIKERDSVIYFWYSKSQEVENKKFFGGSTWKVNGKTFSELIRSPKKPLWKDSKLIFIWRKGKNDLIIRRIEKYPPKPKETKKENPMLYARVSFYLRDFLYNTYGFLYNSSRIKTSFSF